MATTLLKNFLNSLNLYRKTIPMKLLKFEINGKCEILFADSENFIRNRIYAKVEESFQIILSFHRKLLLIII